MNPSIENFSFKLFIENSTSNCLSLAQTKLTELFYKNFFVQLHRFDVSINGRRFFAFLMYKEILKNVVVSICNVTFTGWVRDNVDSQHPAFPVKNWGCYYGK